MKKKKTRFLTTVISLIYIVAIFSAGDAGDGGTGTAKFVGRIEPPAGDAIAGTVGTAKFVGRIEPPAGDAEAGGTGTAGFDDLIEPPGPELPAEQSVSTPPMATVITAKRSEFGEITAFNLNVRSAPDRNATSIKKLNKGTRVRILKRTNGWLEIYHEGQTGFIRNRERYVHIIKEGEDKAEPASSTAPEEKPESTVEGIKEESKKITREIKERKEKVRAITQKEKTLLNGLNEIDLSLNKARKKKSDMVNTHIPDPKDIIGDRLDFQTEDAGAGAVGTAEFDGLIVPHLEVEVGSSVAGVLKSVLVDRGDKVTKGQVLARIRSGVERATMELARTRSEMEATVMARRKELEYAIRNEQRVKKLYSQNAIPEREWDEVVTKRTLAEYKLAAALEAKRQAQMELKRASELVEQTIIRSTVTGIVVERFLSKGEYVDDQPILKLAQINPLYVEVILPLQMFGVIDADMSAIVKPEELVGGEYEAKVKIVDKFIEAASSTFRIRLELPNPGNRLPFGLKCKVFFQDVPVEWPEVPKLLKGG